MIQNLFSSLGSVGPASQGFFSSLQKMMSGQRIERAAADPAGSAVVAELDSVGRSERAAVRAVGDGMSLLQGVDGAASEVRDRLVEMRQLAVAAASDPVGDAGRASLQEQVVQLRDAIDDVAGRAELGGVSLASGAQASVEVQVGPEGTDAVSLDTPDLGSVALGVGTIDLSTREGALQAIDVLDGSIEQVGQVRATAGAQHARLESAVGSGSARAAVQAAASSRIGDADMAREIAKTTQSALQLDVATATQVQSSQLARVSAMALLG